MHKTESGAKPPENFREFMKFYTIFSHIIKRRGGHLGTSRKSGKDNCCPPPLPQSGYGTADYIFLII